MIMRVAALILQILTLQRKIKRKLIIFKNRMQSIHVQERNRIVT